MYKYKHQIFVFDHIFSIRKIQHMVTFWHRLNYKQTFDISVKKISCYFTMCITQ